jgi:hypothetical protein
VHAFAGGNPPGGEAFQVVCISCLDNASAEEIIAAPVNYVDGRHDDYEHAPAQTGHL